MRSHEHGGDRVRTPDRDHACIEIACGKGTYVRALAHELGQKLGCGAHLATLRRVVSGKFNVQDALQFEDALKLSSSDFQLRVIPFLKLAAQTSLPAG